MLSSEDSNSFYMVQDSRVIKGVEKIVMHGWDAMKSFPRRQDFVCVNGFGFTCKKGV